MSHSNDRTLGELSPLDLTLLFCFFLFLLLLPFLLFDEPEADDPIVPAIRTTLDFDRRDLGSLIDAKEE